MTWWFRLGTCRTSRGERGRGSLVSAGLGLVLSAALVSCGCDSASFVPARPAELSNTVGPAGPSLNVSPTGAVQAGARPIELIAAPRDPVNAEVLKTGARMQAGLDKVRVQIMVPKPTDPPAIQAELVRAAIARDPLALVVEPADPNDPELGRAIDEARGRGLIVVVVGHPLPGSRPTQGPQAAAGPSGNLAAPLFTVVPESFKDSAKQLVALTIRNARNGNLVPEGGAVIMIDTTIDSLVEDRVKAFREALKASGISTIEEFRFQGEVSAAKKRFIDLMRANRKLALVFATDLSGSTVAYEATSDLGEERPFILSSYSSDEQSSNLSRAGEFAGVAEFDYDRLIRKGVNVAAAASSGRTLPERVQLRVQVHQSSETAAIPRMKRMMDERSKVTSGSPR